MRNCLIVAVSLLCATSASADTTHEFWPELDVWYRFSSATQALFTAAATRNRDDGDRADAELALYVDHRSNDRISYRAGYLQGIKTRDDDGSSEQRLVFDFNYRWHFGSHTQLTDRSRLDLRNIGGEQSFRLRNRLRIEQETKVRGHPLTPYLSLEAYYDDRFGSVSRWRTEAGATISQGKLFEWDLYAGWQRDSEPESKRAAGFGITLNVKLPRR